MVSLLQNTFLFILTVVDRQLSETKERHGG